MKVRWKLLISLCLVIALISHVYGEVVIQNAGFEELDSDGKPVAWDITGPEAGKPQISTELAQGGRHSIRFEARGQSNGFQAVFQKIEVKGGAPYTFTVDVRSDPKAPFRGTDAYGQLVVQWFDSNGQEIGRVWSPGWNRTLTRLRWETFEVRKVKAPAEAASALVGVHLYEKSGASGAFFADNVTVSGP